MNEVNDLDITADIRELRRLVAAQSERIAELETHAATQTPPEERSTRRGVLRLAGAAVVGGAAASLLGAQPAAATTAAMFYGVGQSAGSDTTSLSSSHAGNTFFASNSSTGAGLWGEGTGSGTGVVGRVSGPTAAAYGVWGQIIGTSGNALVATGGASQLLLEPYAGSAAPSAGVHSAGEVVTNAGGAFYCVFPGTPGTWRKLAGTASAGTFHAIAPTRVYDSRAVAPSPGLLDTGSNRTISVADGRNSVGTVTAANIVPAGATAVMANVTVTGTTGGFGYLAINPGGNTVEGASTINWFGAGQTLANGVGLTLNASRQLTVICNGGGSTHFIVDIAGYYL